MNEELENELRSFKEWYLQWSWQLPTPTQERISVCGPQHTVEDAKGFVVDYVEGLVKQAFELGEKTVREKFRKYSSKYYFKNKTKRLKNSRAWKLKNKKKNSEHYKKYYQKNRKKILEYQRKQYAIKKNPIIKLYA